MKARATARANIALAKYWGKCDAALNLPAVPSVSLTLDALRTETVVTRDPSLREDVITSGNERDLYQRNAPQVEAGLYLVPKVIE